MVNVKLTYIKQQKGKTMKTLHRNDIFIGFGLFMASLALLLTFSTIKVAAATLTWDGEGADDNFSTAANWSADTFPVDDDVIVFPSSVDSDTTDGDDRILNNDLVSISLAGIQFTGTYATGDNDFYQIQGNDIIITGDITSDAGYPKIEVNLTLGASINSSVADLVYSPIATLDVSTFNLTTSNTPTIIGEISGSGSLTLTDGASFVGAIPNFTGDIVINGGQLSVIGDCQDFNTAQSIRVAGDGSINLNCNSGASTISVPIILQGDGEDPFTQDDAGLKTTFYTPALSVYSSSTEEDIQVEIDSLTLDANSSYGSIMSASSTVTVNSITKNGFSLSRVPGSSGKLIIEGSQVSSDYNTYIDKTDTTSTYTSTVEDKSYTIVSANQPNVTYTVSSGGILGGDGTVGPINVLSGGKLAPGTSPGCLNSGNLTLATGGTFEVEIGGTTVCSEYDQQRVVGTVDLGDSNLSTILWNNYVPVAGGSYTIIDNDGTDAIIGTFSNMPEGSTFTINGVVMEITYNGGDGNDIVLSVVSVPATPATGFASIARNPFTSLGLSTLSAIAIIVIVKKRNQLSRNI
jgi:hypothetical protein